MQNNWAKTLAEFLQQHPGVGAVRLNSETRTVSVATLGDVDLQDLRNRLAATIAAIETELAKPPAAPTGFNLVQQGAVTEMTGSACVTATRLWQWREFSWSSLEPQALPKEQGEEYVHEEPEWKELALYASVCGVLGILGFIVGLTGFGPAWLAKVLYAVALLAGGYDAAKDSFENLKERKIDIHFLMLAVAVGAICIGAWGEAVLLLFLFSASGAMEEYALDRTQREVSSLLKSSPKQATRVGPDGHDCPVPVETLQVGDLLRVKPGDAFPADGTVTKGRSSSDESALTGEAVPVEKGVGDPVFSGTLNLWGMVEYTVTRLPSESTLQKIIRLIQTAQKLRSPSERFTDRFGAGYSIFVLGLCAAMFLVWWLGFGLPAFENSEEVRSAFYRAMTLLVVMSPCALVLSIPSAILAAIAWGARHGVLFRGGAAIEKLAAINAVALDKTGTLTTGELAVVGCESFPAGRDREVMELAFALESKSQHPIARAIVKHARAMGLQRTEVDEFQSMTGKGVRGRYDGATVLLGRRELLETGPLADWAAALPPASPELSEVWVVTPSLVGRVLLRDEIREESRGVLAELHRLGIRTLMLTGDRRHAAESVAQALGVDEVRAGLTPEDKVMAIQQLRTQGFRIAMVGDGVNDAPSLAAADVSVAMGARGSDAALEQAEIILMHDRIENFLAAQRLSRRARRIIRQNLALSLGVVLVMALASAGGFVPLAVGVAAHEGSTLVVCLNSLRLLFGRNQGPRLSAPQANADTKLTP